MANKLLTGTYPSGYALASRWAGAVIEAAALIEGAGFTADALASVTNEGTVAAAAGAAGGGGEQGAVGNIGVALLAGGGLINLASVEGGAGGAGGVDAGGGAGGAGVLLEATGSATNKGVIVGGAGGLDGAKGIRGGSGGAGITLSAAGSLTNGGSIVGGAGMGGGRGGTGVALGDGGLLVNNGGAIIGGAGVHGGTGVALVDGGTLRNKNGDIVGGSGGDGDGVTSGTMAVSIDNSGSIFGGGGGTSAADLDGGDAVSLGAGGAISNNGLIAGGKGRDSTPTTNSGLGGIGIVTAGDGTLVNRATIRGGSGGYGSDATYPAAGGGAGGDAISFDSGLVTNFGGVIVGGAGGAGGLGPGSPDFDTGGSGVVLGSGVVDNSAGRIIGGAGGSASAYNNGGLGGDGVEITGTGAVDNESLIQGGSGGNGGANDPPYYAKKGEGGHGGDGLVLSAGGYVTNSGNILGGAGGNGGLDEGYYSYGGAGGIGVDLDGVGTVTNSGLIEGGSGGDDIGYPGIGVRMAGGLLENSGRILGGVYGTGVEMREASAPGTVLNSGTIAGLGPNGGLGLRDGLLLYDQTSVTNGGARNASAVIESGSYGIDDHAHSTITNFGTIAGLDEFGCGVRFKAGGYLVNEGSILGGSLTANVPDDKDPAIRMEGNGVITNGSVADQTALIRGLVGISASQGAATVINYGTIQADGTYDNHTYSVRFASSSDELVVEAGSKFVGSIVGGFGTLVLVGGGGTISRLGSSTGRCVGSEVAKFSGFGSYVIGAAGSWTLAGLNELNVDQNVTVASGGTLALAAGADLVQLGGTVADDGLIVALGPGEMSIGGIVENSGTILAQGATLKCESGVSAEGKVEIGAAGTIIFGAGFVGAVSFTGSSGELVLAKSRTYTGSITGFSTSGDASLDLEDIVFAGAAASFTGTAASGVLTVTSGANTSRINLEGNYLGATFTLSADSSGGTIVTDSADAPAVAPITQAIAAFASVGVAGDGVTHAVERRAPAMLSRPGTSIA